MSTTSAIRRAQKLRERRAFDALRALDATLPDGERGIDGEEPDFVLRGDNGTIGIEVTEYFTPVLPGARWTLKEREKVTSRIASRATCRCVALGLSNVIASIEFDNTTELLKDEIELIAHAVAELVRPATLDRLPTLRVRNPRVLPPGVIDLWAHHRPHMEPPFVGTAWGGQVEKVDEGALLKLIAAKERKLSIYRRRCDAVWLLIIVDPFHASSMGYVPPEYRLAGSEFDRVIALQGWSYLTNVWRSSGLNAKRIAG